MKLPVAARNALRGKLRSHPDIDRHVSSTAEINQLRKDELLALARKLSINVRALIAETEKNTSGLDAVLEEEELELHRYSEAYPAFEGTLEDELKLELFGKPLTYKLRVVFQHTPEWEYYDLNRDCVMRGWPMGRMHMEVLTRPTRLGWEIGVDGKLQKQKNTPTWKQIDFFEADLLPDDVLDDIDERIDQLCRKQDAARRAKVSADTKA